MSRKEVSPVQVGQFGFVFLWALSLFVGLSQAQAAVDAVPTFHSIGIRWNPTSGSSGNEALVRYRKAGASAWKDGHPLWFDSGEEEYRGSLVSMEPATSYDIELNNGVTTEIKLVSTWSESFPIAQTISLPLPGTSTSSTQVLTQGGSASGYVLYTSAPGVVFDGGGQTSNNIVVKASYVIIRGLTLRGAAKHAIEFPKSAGYSDVVIEDNDISQWGSLDGDTLFGIPYQSAIRADDPNTHHRLIIQRNHMHDPVGDTNSWCEFRDADATPDPGCGQHPYGHAPIRISDSAGNHVIRYNTLTTDDEHYFYDAIGGQAGGDLSPNFDDTDIYGNYIERSWDNPIEAEGAGRNTRIWGNFIDRSYSALGLNPVTRGPTYVFRNVIRAAKKGNVNNDEAETSRFIKAHGSSGRIYVYHNTLLQPPSPLHGVTRGIHGGTNFVSRNNILHVWSQVQNSSISAGASDNDFDYDLFSGSVPSGEENHGIDGTPTYDASNQSFQFYLTSGSLGHNQGVVVPNFSDVFGESAPDMGAFEKGLPPVEFGVNAYDGSSGSTDDTPPAPVTGLQVY